MLPNLRIRTVQVAWIYCFDPCWFVAIVEIFGGDAVEGGRVDEGLNGQKLIDSHFQQNMLYTSSLTAVTRIQSLNVRVAF